MAKQLWNIVSRLLVFLQENFLLMRVLTSGLRAVFLESLANCSKKPGSGFSIGTGVIVTTPVGPLRLEVASQDFTGDWRFNLGVGWKF
jgi:outer membrane protein insertion porin family